MSNTELNRIIKRFNYFYGLIIVGLFVSSVSFITFTNYRNKLQMAKSIGHIVEEKLKNDDMRDVVKILSSSQIDAFEAISYYNYSGKRIVTFPPSINPSYFKRIGFFKKISVFPLEIDLYFDTDKKVKSGTLKFSIKYLDSIVMTAFIWILFLLFLIPLARHYKKLIVRNFAQEAQEIKSHAIREVVRQIRHDSRGAIQAIMAVMNSSQNLDELESDTLHSATHRLEVMLSDENISQVKMDTNQVKSNRLNHLFTSVKEIIREKVILYSYEDNINIDFNYSIEILTIFHNMDETIFKRVISNLLDNAFEAIKLKGCKGRICVDLYIKNSLFIINILDNGVGIKKENLSKIGNKGFSLKKEESGLGFSWSRNQIEKIGGKLEIESQFFKETSVTLSIPFDQLGPEIAKEISLKNIDRVITIDDDPSVSQILNEKIKIITRDSLKVINYRSGEDFFAGIEIDHDNRSLYIVDFDLGAGRLNGTQIIEKLGTHRDVFLLTNNFDDLEVQRYCQNYKIQIIPKTIINDFIFSLS